MVRGLGFVLGVAGVRLPDVLGWRLEWFVVARPQSIQSLGLDEAVRAGRKAVVQDAGNEAGRETGAEGSTLPGERSCGGADKGEPGLSPHRQAFFDFLEHLGFFGQAPFLVFDLAKLSIELVHDSLQLAEQVAVFFCEVWIVRSWENFKDRTGRANNARCVDYGDVAGGAGFLWISAFPRFVSFIAFHDKLNLRRLVLCEALHARGTRCDDCVREFGGLKFGVREVGVREVGAPEVGVREVRSSEARSREVRSPEVRSNEVSCLNACAREVGTRQVGSFEIGAVEDGAHEVDILEVGTTEIGTLKRSVREVYIAAGVSFTPYVPLRGPMVPQYLHEFVVGHDAPPFRNSNNGTHQSRQVRGITEMVQRIIDARNEMSFNARTAMTDTHRRRRAQPHQKPAETEGTPPLPQNGCA